MRLREKCPHWEKLGTEDLLRQAGFPVLRALMPRIAEWYKVALPMWAVLQYFGYLGGGPGYPLIGPETDEAQISCQLPSHGSTDAAPSSRYYNFDRNENSDRFGHVYCFGSRCQKSYTSFWYLHAMMRSRHDHKYIDSILLIEKVFRVPFPRDLLLDADPERLDDEERQAQAREDVARRFAQARLLRERVRPERPREYLLALCALYTQPMEAPAVADA